MVRPSTGGCRSSPRALTLSAPAADTRAMKIFLVAVLAAACLAGCGESRPDAWSTIHMTASIAENATHGCIRQPGPVDRCGDTAKEFCRSYVPALKRLREVADPSDGKEARLDHDTAVQGLYLCKQIEAS